MIKPLNKKKMTKKPTTTPPPPQKDIRDALTLFQKTLAKRYRHDFSAEKEKKLREWLRRSVLINNWSDSLHFLTLFKEDFKNDLVKMAENYDQGIQGIYELWKKCSDKQPEIKEKTPKTIRNKK